MDGGEDRQITAKRRHTDRDLSAKLGPSYRWSIGGAVSCGGLGKLM